MRRLYSLLFFGDLGLDPDGDGQLTAEEGAQLNGFGMKWIDGFQGNTYVLMDGQPIPIFGPRDWTATYSEGKLSSTHIRDLVTPVPVAASPLVIQADDPECYCAHVILLPVVVTGGYGAAGAGAAAGWSGAGLLGVQHARQRTRSTADPGYDPSLSRHLDHGHDHAHDNARFNHPHDHGPSCTHAHGPSLEQVESLTGWRDGLALVAGIALKPCTGALFVLIVTYQLGLALIGVAGAFVMGLGTAVVTISAALLAVWAREGALSGLGAGRLSQVLPYAELAVGSVIAFAALGLLIGGL